MSDPNFGELPPVGASAEEPVEERLTGGLCLIVLQDSINGKHVGELSPLLAEELDKATTGALSEVGLGGGGIEVRHTVCRAENCLHTSSIVEYTSAPDQEARLIAPLPDFPGLEACRAIKTYLSRI